MKNQYLLYTKKKERRKTVYVLLVTKYLWRLEDVYLADGCTYPFDRSGLSISRKLVSSVLRAGCDLEVPEDELSFPF